MGNKNILTRSKMTGITILVGTFVPHNEVTNMTTRTNAEDKCSCNVFQSTDIKNNHTLRSSDGQLVDMNTLPAGQTGHNRVSVRVYSTVGDDGEQIQVMQ